METSEFDVMLTELEQELEAMAPSKDEGGTSIPCPVRYPYPAGEVASSHLAFRPNGTLVFVCFRQ
jgi:hypothetical protein